VLSAKPSKRHAEACSVSQRGVTAASEPSSLIRPFGSWEALNSFALDEMVQVLHHTALTLLDPIVEMTGTTFRILDQRESLHNVESMSRRIERQQQAGNQPYIENRPKQAVRS
jgi:hypothetical protein